MLISANEINNILKIAGNVVTVRGKKYFEQDRVKMFDFNYTSTTSSIRPYKTERNAVLSMAQYSVICPCCFTKYRLRTSEKSKK